MSAPSRCPYSGSQSSESPVPVRRGPRGCAFSAMGPNCPVPSVSTYDPQQAGWLHAQERKAMNELLLPDAPSKEVTKGLKNADELNPSDDDVLAVALGAPARRVLTRAEEIGPRTGWKDGYLTSSHGFTPPDPSASPVALRTSPGRVWSDLCERMPGVVARGNMRNSILALPLVHGTADVIPDTALWAATVCLGILASVYRYEERNDGSDGITVAAPPGTFKNITGDADDEEEETKGIPRNIAIPLRQICSRMGRPLPHLTQYDVSIYNYKIRDSTSVNPYVARIENMDLRWPVFNDRGEAMFLLCMAEVHGCFVRGVETVTRCQEAVMNRDPEGLLREMVELKSYIDQLPYVFHKISVNPNSGENFANPVEWGQRYAKFSAPLSSRVPALSGLALPLFLLMDAFIGRTKYKTFLGIEAVHLRRWLPLNIRAFITAIENHYRIPEFIKMSGDPRLDGVLEGLVESYAGERGFMGTHRYKVYGFLEVVAKTGRTETNGNSGAGDSGGRPWEEVHRSLSDSMKERLEPYRGKVAVQPHEMRGSFEECRFNARILGRQIIDNDSKRATGMVTFDLQGTGVTFQPGDRLAVMPLNPSSEVEKVSAALGLEETKDKRIPLENGSTWARFEKHLAEATKTPGVKITVQDVLKRGHLSPLTKDLVMNLHSILKASSSTIIGLLTSEQWPIRGSIGDLLQKVIDEVPEHIWNRAFPLSDLSWLPKLIELEVPRTYSISNASNELLPSMIDLTVSRSEGKRHPAITGSDSELTAYGVSSGFLNPDPKLEDPLSTETEVLIGLSRPINFQLPPSSTVPVAMFAGGSGIAPFRGFWQARAHNGIGRNILFMGVQSRDKFLYEQELRGLVQQGALELYTAFSRDRKGLVYDPSSRDLIERDMEPRYINTTIVDQGRLVSELVMSKNQGGMGGYLYICGSVSVFETVMSGIKKAIYKYQAATESTAEQLLATAFAERRFMLDIFMTPQALSYQMPTIPMSQLATHTGHRKGSRMWIGVHGGCYDITDFLPIHPGGTLIVAASAGLDATKTFDDLAHTSNPEVSSLLTKYFIGHLAPKPEFRSSEIGKLFDVWAQYLRMTVESLTTLSFEANNILEDSKIWFSGGLFNIGGVRKFYQFQSRLMQNAFQTLFGTSIQEIYLKLSFALANSGLPNIQLPDIMGTITRAQSSGAASKASKEISEIGQFVCASSTSSQFHENGILKYAQTVTELDLKFLESVRDEAGAGMDAFDAVASMSAMPSAKLVKISAFLLSVLERIAKRVESFYATVAEHSIYRPELEQNPARTRWNTLRRKINDGSFFVLADVPLLSKHDESDPFSGKKSHTKPVDFSEVFLHAQRELSRPAPNSPRLPNKSAAARNNGNSSLAAAHSARAAPPADAPSSYDDQTQREARNRLESFIEKNKKTMHRLSKLPAIPQGIDLEQLTKAFAKDVKLEDLTVQIAEPQPEIHAQPRKQDIPPEPKLTESKDDAHKRRTLRAPENPSDRPRSRSRPSAAIAKVHTESSPPGSRSASQTRPPLPVQRVATEPTPPSSRSTSHARANSAPHDDPASPPPPPSKPSFPHLAPVAYAPDRAGRTPYETYISASGSHSHSGSHQSQGHSHQSHSQPHSQHHPQSHPSQPSQPTPYETNTLTAPTKDLPPRPRPRPARTDSAASMSSIYEQYGAEPDDIAPAPLNYRGKQGSVAGRRGNGREDGGRVGGGREGARRDRDREWGAVSNGAVSVPKPLSVTGSMRKSRFEPGAGFEAERVRVLREAGKGF